MILHVGGEKFEFNNYQSLVTTENNHVEIIFDPEFDCKLFLNLKDLTHIIKSAESFLNEPSR
jgi:hypothetical protein